MHWFQPKNDASKLELNYKILYRNTLNFVVLGYNFLNFGSTCTDIKPQVVLHWIIASSSYQTAQYGVHHTVHLCNGATSTSFDSSRRNKIIYQLEHTEATDLISELSSLYDWAAECTAAGHSAGTIEFNSGFGRGHVYGEIQGGPFLG